MSELPPFSYVEAFEQGRYQQAAMDETLQRVAKEDGDRLALAFMVLADAYLDAESGLQDEARTKLARVIELTRPLEGFKPNALTQHATQCLEYLSMGKTLPELPSHF
ncbi:MAG: hypothetical protein R3185_00275 [Candidatus Thermoplasmatota archaeon]|nr:hypothetical protein [Candidatus Thermoplasmatota archaeon]